MVPKILLIVLLGGEGCRTPEGLLLLAIIFPQWLCPAQKGFSFGSLASSV